MQSLREKLLKAGLISEERAKAAPEPRSERPERPERNGSIRAERSAPQRPSPKTGREAPIPKLPPLAVPNNKELQRLEAKKQVELERQMRELVASTQLEIAPGERTFYFVTRKNRLRRMEITPEIAERLEKGELAVVERPDPGQIEHAIVPASTAERLLAMSERAVRFFNREGSAVGFLSDEELANRQRDEAERAEKPAPA